MKKIIKSILTTTAFASPLLALPTVLSSCGTKMEKFEYTFNAQNPAKDFVPEDVLAAQSFDADKITYEFIKNINENKKILADTIVYGVINDFFYFNNDVSIDFTEAIGRITANIGELNPETSRCTFGYSFELELNEKIYETSIDFYNIPFTLYRWEEEENDLNWCFAPVHTALARYDDSQTARKSIVTSYLAYLNNWKIIISVSGEMSKEMGFPSSLDIAIGNEYSPLWNSYMFQDVCLFGHSFNKINYLKNIQINEGE